MQHTTKQIIPSWIGFAISTIRQHRVSSCNQRHSNINDYHPQNFVPSYANKTQSNWNRINCGCFSPGNLSKGSGNSAETPRIFWVHGIDC